MNKIISLAILLSLESIYSENPLTWEFAASAGAANTAKLTGWNSLNKNNPYNLELSLGKKFMNLQISCFTGLFLGNQILNQSPLAIIPLELQIELGVTNYLFSRWRFGRAYIEKSNNNGYSYSSGLALGYQKQNETGRFFILLHSDYHYMPLLKNNTVLPGIVVDAPDHYGSILLYGLQIGYGMYF